MKHPGRAVILALFVMSTVTVSAYIINIFLTMLQVTYSTPRLSVYAPGAGLIVNLISSNLAMDPAVQARLAVARDFALIHISIYACLLLLASTFALSMRNPRGFFTLLSCGLFVIVPGTAILKLWVPVYFAERAPNVRWAFLDLQGAVLQTGLSLPLYMALFFAGTLILTEEQPRAAGAQ
jgi:hypothetical protein